MKFIYSYTDLKWDLSIGYSHEQICYMPSVVIHEWSLFIATQKINKHTYQLISVNALGLAHKQYNFMQSSSYKTTRDRIRIND
jgi:hypothetical protein